MHRRHGFTLLELTVTVGVIALLLGLLFPALSAARRSSRAARELTAARQLMTAYRSYAYDNRGTVMPGYYYESPPLPAPDENGEDLSQGPLGREIAARYPWRIAPYLDYDFNGLYLDPNVRAALDKDLGAVKAEYLLSLYPALGMNSYFVGGDSNSTSCAFTDLCRQVFGDFYVTRVSAVRHPTRLITFGSARVSGQLAMAGVGSPLVQGYFRIVPPYFEGPRWTSYRIDCEADGCTADFGYISLRHSFREAAIGFFDGHTGTLGEESLRDMRHWCDRADAPDWTLEPK